MSKLKIYSYKNCGTCKKAIKFLDENEVSYELVDITLTPPSKSELKMVLKGMEGNIKKLFNTSGQVYRGEGYSEKLKTMSDQEAINDLSEKGKLIKRPLVVLNGVGICGFKEEAWTQFLKL